MRLKMSSAKWRPFCPGKMISFIASAASTWPSAHSMMNNQWLPTTRIALCLRNRNHHENEMHYNDVIISVMASLTTGFSIVYSTACPGANQRKHQSSASLAFVGGIQRWPVNSPYKEPVTRKMFPFDDVIMKKVVTLTGLCGDWGYCITIKCSACIFYLHKLSSFV